MLFSIFCALTKTLKFITNENPENLMIEFWKELKEIERKINKKISKSLKLSKYDLER
jgi:predicted transglutaminase-like cysteine proteinase